MTLLTPTIMVVVSVLIGVLAGYFLRQIIILRKKSSLELKIKQQLLDAKSKAQNTIEAATKKAESVLEKAKQEEKERGEQTRKLEERVVRREELIEKHRQELDKEGQELKEKIEKVHKVKEDVETLEGAKRKELEKIASLSENEAKQELLQDIEKQYETDLITHIQKLENYSQTELERRSREILASTMQRLASSTASEVTTTTVSIPSDDIKGKIIGKEGRNIRAIERAAGVEVVVDDTPGSIVISAFDPIRRQIAKIALEQLIVDGRIQPARIEEEVEKAKNEVEKITKEAGEAATYEVGVFDIDPRLLRLLGRLHFRTSYGQNILQHSIETAHIAGMLASELGADVQIAKKGALLHDIGKAMDHEVQGSHVDIGKRILKKFNADETIIQAMQSHHEEYPYETMESIIIHTADAVSASRPGARRDTLENYLKRLEDLEEIANSFGEVEKSYAIQAGREIRIFVTPEKISDLETKKLSRSIADRIEQELKYPGEIKVNVIRETRAVELAQ